MSLIFLKMYITYIHAHTYVLTIYCQIGAALNVVSFVSRFKGLRREASSPRSRGRRLSMSSKAKEALDRQNEEQGDDSHSPLPGSMPSSPGSGFPNPVSPPHRSPHRLPPLSGSQPRQAVRNTSDAALYRGAVEEAERVNQSPPHGLFESPSHSGWP